MKRSEAINKLIHKVSCPHEIITQHNYETGIYHDRAERLLSFIEKELGMLPPKVKVESLSFVINPETGERGEFKSWTYKSEWEPEDDT